jgi:hypothetical protein
MKWVVRSCIVLGAVKLNSSSVTVQLIYFAEQWLIIGGFGTLRWIPWGESTKVFCLNSRDPSGHARLPFIIISKFHPRTAHEGPQEEWMYSCTLPLTSALDGVGGQRYGQAVLLPVKTRYP